MLRKGILIAALCLLPATAQAQDVENPWELTLGGGGQNSEDFDGFAARVDASLGYYFNEAWEVSIRQSLTYSDFFGSSMNGSTRVALDVHFPLGDRSQWVPFVGGQFGYVYGDDLNETFMAGPEAGLKYYVNSTTFVFAMAEYQFFFDSGDEADDAADDGQFLYTLGIGFRF
jgi:Outer membrane protein beta-barrel domain